MGTLDPGSNQISDSGGIIIAFVGGVLLSVLLLGVIIMYFSIKKRKNASR